MECGGSEIWLTSTNAWGKGQQSRAAAQEEKKKVDENEQLVGKETDTDSEYVKALEKYTNRSTKTTSASDNSNNSDFGNKWWCKFGHSRRGLEHIVSSSEGKARQQSVLLAIEMILEEQKRQRVTRTKDANKLRNVALQYTVGQGIWRWRRERQTTRLSRRILIWRPRVDLIILRRSRSICC
jgi:hypothetical protein